MMVAKKHDFSKFSSYLIGVYCFMTTVL